jgi:hypothetical protein
MGLSGTYWRLDDMSENEVNLIEIATNLSKLCRYNGNCKGQYSVAEHSVYVSRLVPQHLALEALMHDAAEYVLGDCIAPVKGLLPGYEELEHAVHSHIADTFGLPHDIAPEVKLADARMFVTEFHQLFDPADGDAETLRLYEDAGIEPADFMVIGYPWWAARTMFLERFKELWQ